MDAAQRDVPGDCSRLIDSEAFQHSPRFFESAFENPALQLAASIAPRRYRAEIVGMTLWLEFFASPINNRLVRELEDFDIDTRFFVLHGAIDNVSEGHGRQALRAVHSLMAEVNDAVQREALFERVWHGFIAFQVTADAVMADLEKHYQAQMASAASEVEGAVVQLPRGDVEHHFPALSAALDERTGPLAERSDAAALVARFATVICRKAPYAAQLHGVQRVRGVNLNDAFARCVCAAASGATPSKVCVSRVDEAVVQAALEHVERALVNESLIAAQWMAAGVAGGACRCWEHALALALRFSASPHLVCQAGECPLTRELVSSVRGPMFCVFTTAELDLFRQLAHSLATQGADHGAPGVDVSVTTTTTTTHTAKSAVQQDSFFSDARDVLAKVLPRAAKAHGSSTRLGSAGYRVQDVCASLAISPAYVNRVLASADHTTATTPLPNQFASAADFVTATLAEEYASNRRIAGAGGSPGVEDVDGVSLQARIERVGAFSPFVAALGKGRCMARVFARAQKETLLLFFERSAACEGDVC